MGSRPTTGTTVTLDPLPPDVIERLVIAATEATPLRPHEIAAIVDRARGQPAVRRGGHAGRPEHRARWTQLPESVQAAMSAQIDLLPPGRAAHPALLRGARPQLPASRCCERTLAADGLALGPAALDGLRAFLEPDGPDRLAVPQQPRSGRRLRGAGLPDPQHACTGRPARRWRR